MPAVKPPYIIPIFLPFLGCPFTCVYCQQEKITGEESRFPTPSEVEVRIQTFLKTRRKGKYSHNEVAFYGGTFTGLPAEIRRGLLQAAHHFVLSGDIQSLRASTKPDFISIHILEELRAYQMNTIELGVQSLNDAVLKNTGRGYGKKEVITAVRLLKDQRMRVGLQLMPGLPGADEEEALETARAAISLAPDFVRIYPTVVLKDTTLERHYRQGRYRPWSLEQAVRVCRQLKTRFEAARIPVIKMGLEFSTDERAGIVAGPYHPEFHSLVG